MKTSVIGRPLACARRGAGRTLAGPHARIKGDQEAPAPALAPAHAATLRHKLRQRMSPLSRPGFPRRYLQSARPSGARNRPRGAPSDPPLHAAQAVSGPGVRLFLRGAAARFHPAGMLLRGGHPGRPGAHLAGE